MERLPEDMKNDIFSRLPIKYILRCRCVCKSWDSIVSSPSFAATHFHRSSALTSITNYMINYFKDGECDGEGDDENRLFFLEDDGEDQEANNLKGSEENFTLNHVKPIDFPCITSSLAECAGAIFTGACNGFLCLSAKDLHFGFTSLCPTNPMYLFNPVTGEHALLPEFKETRLYNCVNGFGFDVTNQEYKVVVVYFYGNYNLMQVHTVGKDRSWRMSEFDVIPGFLSYVLETSQSLLFDGSLNWIILNSIDDKPKKTFHRLGDRGFNDPKRVFILSFQLDGEQLKIIPMPEPLSVMKPYFRDAMDYALQLCGGCLSVAYSSSESVVDMWIMKNSNWSKQYSIQLSSLDRLLSRRDQVKPLGFRKNGELMLLFKQQLISYNTENGKYKILQLDGQLPISTLVVPFPFVGSLISLRSAFGDEFADNKVIRTSEFGNPMQKQVFYMGSELGQITVKRIIELPDGE